MINLTKNKTIIVDVVFTIFLGVLGCLYSPVTDFLKQYGREKKYNFVGVKDLNQFTCDQIDLTDECPKLKFSNIEKEKMGKMPISHYFFIIDHTISFTSDTRHKQYYLDALKAYITKGISIDSLDYKLSQTPISDIVILFLIKNIIEINTTDFNITIADMNGRSLNNLGEKWNQIKTNENLQKKYELFLDLILRYVNPVTTGEQQSEFCKILNDFESNYFNEIANSNKNIEVVFLSDFILEPYQPNERGCNIDELKKKLKTIALGKYKTVYRFIKYPIPSSQVYTENKVDISPIIKELFDDRYVDLTDTSISKIEQSENLKSLITFSLESNKVAEYYDMSQKIGEVYYANSIVFDSNVEVDTTKYLLTFYSKHQLQVQFQYETKNARPEPIELNKSLILNPEDNAVYKFAQSKNIDIKDGVIKLKIFDCTKNITYLRNIAFRERMPYNLAILFLIFTSLFLNTIIFTIIISLLGATKKKHKISPFLRLTFYLISIVGSGVFVYVNYPFFSLISVHFKDVFLPYLFSLLGSFLIIYAFLREKEERSILKTNLNIPEDKTNNEILKKK